MTFPPGGDFAGFMSGWGWVIFSVVAAVFSAAMFLVNQYLKQPGYMLVFAMRVIAVLALWPFMSLIRFPGEWQFYAAMAATVVTATFSDIRTFNVAAKYGGGVTARVQPLTVWGAFFVWFLFDPALLSGYIANPLNTAGVLAALGGCAYFAQRLNRCEVSKSALTEMMPALIGYVLTAVLNKYAMSFGNVHSTAHAYMFVQSALAVPILGVYALMRTRAQKTSFVLSGRTMALASTLMAVAWIGHMIFKNYAMAFTPNPAFQNALNLTAPVFIAIFYRAIRHKEEADVRSGMGIVACAVLLALFTVR